MDEAGEGHLREADVEADGTGHEEVVVVALDGSVAAVLAAFVGKVFLQTFLVALYVFPFADRLDELGYDHRFGGRVGVEPILNRDSAQDVVFRGAAGVEVGVDIGYLIENE